MQIDFVEIIMDTLIDGVRLLPFLFITYLIMECIEHRAGNHMKIYVKRAGNWGPAIGSLLGMVPQCGFSTAATTLYAGRVITLGTLFSVYLSTSDEMLPIMISEQVPIGLIARILFLKVMTGMVAGFLIDYVMGKLYPAKMLPEHYHIETMCEHDHCHCEKGVFPSALMHTLEVFLYLIGIGFVINLIVEYVGPERLASTALAQPVIGEMIAGLIGLIPNCAASVAITQFYLEGVMSFGAMMSGLLVGAGVGLLVLFRTNRPVLENIKITAYLYLIGVMTGILLDVVSKVVL